MSRRRKPKVNINYKTGQVHIDFATPPAKNTTVAARYDVVDGPPEPSIIDRVGAIESPSLAKRCADYDAWVREGRSFKLTSFDFVTDPSVPDAYPK